MRWMLPMWWCLWDTKLVARAVCVFLTVCVCFCERIFISLWGPRSGSLLYLWAPKSCVCVCVCFWLVCQTWVHLSRMVNAAAVVELLWLSGSGKCAIAGAGWLTTQSWYRSIPLEGITCLVSKMTFSHRVRSKQPDYSPRLCSVGGIDDFCRI